jgi:hypothetical protein
LQHQLVKVFGGSALEQSQQLSSWTALRLATDDGTDPPKSNSGGYKMGMPLELVSNHRLLEVRQHARFSYRCDGFEHLPSRASPTCERVIAKGHMYVAKVEWRKDRRDPYAGASLDTKVDIGKFCAHCALALFVDIKIAGNHAS